MSTLVITGATATIETGTPIELDVQKVVVEFDEAWNPYCTVTITAALPAASVVAQINPLDDLRVTLGTSQQVDGGTTQTASFDLYLVDRLRDRKADTLTIEATSDDFRLTIRDLIDTDPDESARALQTSLRSIINNRLAGIGAALDASPSTDFDLTRAIRAGNFARNPKAKVNGNDWSWNGPGTYSRQTSGGPSGLPAFLRITGAATAPRHQYGSTGADWLVHNEGEAVIASAWVRCSAAVNVTVQYLSYNSAGVQLRNVSTVVAIAANTWTRVSITMPLIIFPTANGDVVQINGTRGVALWQVPTLAAGATFDVTGLRVSPVTGHLDTDYFDPDTADTTYYSFHEVDVAGWLATGTSTSYRFPMAAYDRAVDALDQQPGQSDWDFLHGLVSIPGYRLFCDENAVWRLVDPSAWPVSPDHFDVETTTAVQFTDRIYLDSPESFDEAVVAYEDPDTVTYDASDTGTRMKAWRGRLRRPYAGIGAAAAIAARGAGRYLEATFEGLADLDIRPSAEVAYQEAAVDVFNGVVRKCTWDSSTGLSTITPRDLVEA